ncbi:MAG: hypothetical protein LCI00_22810 [Chloroflexi bacterium]|nr:hypothetical protein [Chloroflexota bacterium]
MGYFMRYISTDARPVTFATLDEVLAAIDTKYTLRATDLDELVEVLHDGQLYGQVEIDSPEDELFEDDISAFTEMLGEPKTDAERTVAAALVAAQQIVAVEMFWEGSDGEMTFSKFDPLWDWLFANRTGILQADTEGFYNTEGLLVERKFMI